MWNLNCGNIELCSARPRARSRSEAQAHGMLFKRNAKINVNDEQGWKREDEEVIQSKRTK